LKAGGIAAIVIGSVGLLLILLLLVRRRRSRISADEDRHLELVDDKELIGEEGDEDTYVSEEPPRLTHVVGEGDSIISDWTGRDTAAAGMMTDDDVNKMVSGNYGPYARPEGHRSTLGEYKSSMNVHHCNSATCEICEARRQAGPLFLPSATPSPPRLPADAERQYVAGDTVDL
jgi:hypothetical protein